MSNGDPFADFSTSGEHTIIKPSPGGRVRGAATTASTHIASARLPDRQALNPLENAASYLLNLLTGLKNTAQHPDVGGLHRLLITEIQKFEQRSAQLGVSDKMTLTRARFVLCAALDDAILNTPWARHFGWDKQTLSGTFFKNINAGKEFFRLLDKLQQDPAHHQDLLELMYICLALGFKGAYRFYSDQGGELEERREKLYSLLNNLKKPSDTALSPHWQGVTDTRNPLMRYVPLWALAAIAGVILLGIYLFFHVHLTQDSDPVFVNLQQAGKDIPALAVNLPDFVPPKIEVPPSPKPLDIHQYLRQQLADESCLITGDIEVNNPQTEVPEVGGTFIRTQNCGALFDSGKWQIKPKFKELLDRLIPPLQEALREAPGSVLISGHTDSLKGRFISNAELSQNRADAVLNYLIEQIGQNGRFSAEGRADRESVASNKTPQGRAQNRRVEILLLYPYVEL